MNRSGANITTPPPIPRPSILIQVPTVLMNVKGRCEEGRGYYQSLMLQVNSQKIKYPNDEPVFQINLPCLSMYLFFFIIHDYSLIFWMKLFLADLKGFHEILVEEFEVLLWFGFNFLVQPSCISVAKGNYIPNFSIFWVSDFQE